MQNLLDKLLKRTINLLRTERLDYLIIGGLAVAILGEPRMTQDIDFILFISKERLPQFLKSAKRAGFEFKTEDVLANARDKGAFKLMLGNLWIDLIIASTDFERSALKRKIEVKLMKKMINLPSPEDLILLKIIPGREKDLVDAETVVERHRNRLDKKYLESWAQRLSDEAEDLRIWNDLKRLLS